MSDDMEDAERRIVGKWLDPDVPDPWANVAARYLSSEGFAIRLLRLITEHERAGVAPEEALRVVKARCEALLKAQYATD